MTTTEIEIDKLVISEHNTRQPKDTDLGIKELALSLKSAGQTAAILVRPHPNRPGHYEIAAGARRSVAARVAGLQTLRAQIQDMDDDAFHTAILVDNLQRENPDPRAEAELLLKLHERGNNAIEIAAHMGKPEAWVHRRLKLLSVNKKILKEWRKPGSDCHHFTIDMMELVGSLPASEQEEITEGWAAERVSTRADLLRAIQHRAPALKNAPFDLHDPRFFVKDCGPGCATDTSMQGQIFDTGKKGDCARCLNGACFNKRLDLYRNSEYDRLCEEAGGDLPVIAESNVTIKGTEYSPDWKHREWGVEGKPVCRVDREGKLSIGYIAKASSSKNGDTQDEDQETPEQKLKRKINTLQGKRWLLVREQIIAKLEAAKSPDILTCDIDRVIATFGLPFHVTGSVMKPNNPKRWEQVFADKRLAENSPNFPNLPSNPVKCVGNPGWESDDTKNWNSAKSAPRADALWPHVKSVLIGLIPEPKRLMDVYLFENDYRSISKLIGFDVDAAKKQADLEILPPKSFGDVDPHTLK